MSDKSDNFKQYGLFKKSSALSLAAVVLSISNLSSATNTPKYSDAEVTEYTYDDAGLIEIYDDDYDDNSYIATDAKAVDRGYGSSAGEEDYIESSDESFNYALVSDSTKEVSDAARDARDAAIENDDSKNNSFKSNDWSQVATDDASNDRPIESYVSDDDED